MVKRSSPAAAWLVLPALLVLLALTGYPLARTFLYSFTDASLSTLDSPRWIGLENYLYLLRDPDWWRAAWNTGRFTLVSVFLETLIGLAIALLLDSRLRLRGMVRTAVLIPWAIPAVVSARIWAWMFNDFYGVINELLRPIHPALFQVSWLSDERLSLLVLVIVDVWKTTPFMALLILTGLQAIPASVHEAAKVDGATPFRGFRLVTLPLLMPAIRVAVLFRLLDALRIFDLPFVLTSNSRASAVVSIYARQQMIDFQEVGYGSAASFLIFCMIGAIAVAYLMGAREQLGLGKGAGR